MTRVKISRPYSSVPIQWSAFGGRKVAAVFSAYGSYRLNHGAAMMHTTMAQTSVMERIPSMRTTRRSSRARRRLRGRTRTGPSTAGAAWPSSLRVIPGPVGSNPPVSVPLGTIPDPGVRDAVEQVHQEVQDDEDGGG